MRHSNRRRPFWYLRRSSDRVAAEIDEELRSHLEMRADDLQRRGLSPDAAMREAIRQFGDLDTTRQYCREQDRQLEAHVRRGLMIEELLQDVRISLRGLLRAPVMTLAIVLTVGLGIGATTVIFGAIDAALLRPLPYAQPNDLVRIYTDSAPNRFPFSVADYLALTAQQTQFAQIAAFASRPMVYSDGTIAERLRARSVSWNYFDALGIRPAAGRAFEEADARRGGPPAAIVSYRFWQQRLGGRPDALGTAIRLDGVGHTVVGILPRAAGPLEATQDVFVAAHWDPPPRKGPFFLTVIGRLRGGAARAGAAEELHAINRRIFPIWKASYQDDRATWSMMNLDAFIVGDVGTIAGLALTAVALVWLIACGNASSLLIARVTSRRRELAVRAALGASRSRVVRYLLAESVLLAVGASAIGVAIAAAGIDLVRSVGAGYFPRSSEIALDGPVLWVLAALTAASALLFGLVPAVHGSGGPVEEALRSSARGSTGGVAARRLRRALVAAQFAIATPLLIVAGLLLVSLNQLSGVDLGFEESAQRLHPATDDAVRRRRSADIVLERIATTDRRAPRRRRRDPRRQPPAERRQQLQQLRSRRLPRRIGTVAARDAVDRGDARVLRRVRSDAPRRTAARGARRDAHRRAADRRRSGVGPALLSERRRGRQAAAQRRLHHLSMDRRRRRRQRREVRGPGQTRRGVGVSTAGAAGDVAISDRPHSGGCRASAAARSPDDSRARCRRAAVERGDDGGAD
jgi:hypothetical protein